MRRSSLFLALVLVWIALWERWSWANLASGLLVAGLLVGAFPPVRPTLPGRFRPLAVLRFTGYFAWRLVQACAVVAWEEITPSNRINEGIVAVPVRGVSDRLVTLVANAISLCPGTLTLEAEEDPTVLYVHVLHLHDVEAVRRDVQHLEELAIAAFGPVDAVATLRREEDAPGDVETGEDAV